jgi:preprotein translocase subunit SecD
MDGNRIEMVPTEAGLEEALESAMNTAREVVYNRVDPDGTKEVTVVRQGARRILVQVPGLQDPEGLKQLLGKTARLDFKLVDLNADPALVASGRAPAGSQVLPYPENPSGAPTIAVKRTAMVTGDQLTDAKQVFDSTTSEPVVSITFDSQGGRRFARVTQENVNKPFAIILDDVVISAPNINEPILGGQAQISGNFTTESANQLAVALRSGKLPVDLSVVEERTVGPDLGADSIRLGVIAGIVGTALILLYMFITYGRFGVYADITLVLNVILVLAIMAIFNATLTLPGIAGFVLTVGAAVDANVIINERIREEQKRGRNVLQAIEHGYREAQTAIFDANITNVIAGVLLFYFGTGPVRGFAVVMMIGIVTSVFTAVTVTRMFVSLWLRKRPTVLNI